MTRLENPVKPASADTPGMHPGSVRLRILSDLHLGQAGLDLPEAQADIIVLAGDIARPTQSVDWALSSFSQPVLYVPGNHEFYGSSVRRTLDELRRRAEGTHVHVLDNDEITLLGVRFLGSTLWSSFDLDGAAEREHAISQAQAMIRDFSRIESDALPGVPFSPTDMETLFARNRQWLASRLEAGPATAGTPTVVISHHAPSPRSIHPRFAGSPLNGCFVSDCEALMGRAQAALWIHGHTHNSFDYEVKGTRVICNPRGYIFNGALENAQFDPALTIDVSVPARDRAAPRLAAQP